MFESNKSSLCLPRELRREKFRAAGRSRARQGVGQLRDWGELQTGDNHSFIISASTPTLHLHLHLHLRLHQYSFHLAPSSFVTSSSLPGQASSTPTALRSPLPAHSDELLHSPCPASTSQTTTAMQPCTPRAYRYLKPLAQVQPS